MDEQASVAFYREHARPVLGFLARRTQDPELAADLTAEVFAEVWRGRFDPARGDGRSWVLAIAAHKQVDAHRRGHAEDRARRRVPVAAIVLVGAAVLVALWWTYAPHGDERSAVPAEEQRVEPEPAVEPPLSESFRVLREGREVPEPFLIRDGLIPRDAVGADPVTYEAYSSPRRGDAWVVVGAKQLCAIYYGPADATAWGCFEPTPELAKGLVAPIANSFPRSGDTVIALVPDGTRNARALSSDGAERELEIVGNVLVGFDLQPDTVSWVTPNGQSVGFGGQTWPADVPVELAPRFRVIDPANLLPAESVRPPVPAEFGAVGVYDAGPIGRGAEAKVVVGDDIVCVAARFEGADVLPCWPRDDELLGGRERKTEGIGVALLPDGATEVVAVLSDGRELPVRVANNVAVAPGARIEWVVP